MASYPHTQDNTFQLYESAQSSSYDSPVAGYYLSTQEMIPSRPNTQDVGQASTTDAQLLIYPLEWQGGLRSQPAQQLLEVESFPRATTSDSTYIGSHDTPSATTVASSRQTTSSPPPSKATRRSKQRKLQEIVNITEPLSISTNESAIPLKNMHAFVHRSSEDRMKEKEKKNGYIVRPMNAFMLYRSAFADRAKAMFDQNNHQLVSKATGQSWRMETKEIQDYYKNLSEIERDNHQRTWPDYKFSPSKAGPAARKRKGGNSDTEDEPMELDASDFDWTPSGSRKPKTSRGNASRANRHFEVALPHSSPAQYERASSVQVPYYEFGHMGRPLPMSLHANPDLIPEAEYHVEGVHGHIHGHFFTSGGHYQPDRYAMPFQEAPRHGVPGGGSSDLYDFEAPGMIGESQMMLDPSLVLESQHGLESFHNHPFSSFGNETLGQNTLIKVEDAPLQVIGEDVGFLNDCFPTGGRETLKQWVEDTNSRGLGN